MAKAAPQVTLTQEQIDTIVAWTEAKKALDNAKAEELKHRLLIVQTAPFNPDKEEGGQTIKLGEGWKLALDKPMDYKMEPKDIPGVVAAMKSLAAANPLAAEGLIRWEPVMSVSAYKKLSEEEKKILAPVVTIKPGTPTIELKPPPTPKA